LSQRCNNQTEELRQKSSHLDALAKEYQIKTLELAEKEAYCEELSTKM